MVGIAMDDKLFNKFRDYWLDKENRSQERIPAASVARELIEYALEHMNGKQDNSEASDSVTEQPVEPDTSQDAKQDSKQNAFSDLKF